MTNKTETFEWLFEEVKKLYPKANNNIFSINFEVQKGIDIKITESCDGFEVKFETECRKCANYYEDTLFISDNYKKVIKVIDSLKDCESKIKNLKELLNLIKSEIDEKAIFYDEEILCNLDMPYSSQILIGDGYFYQTNRECSSCEKDDVYIFPLGIKNFNLSRIFNIIRTIKQFEDTVK
jgi:hypothetical protein